MSGRVERAVRRDLRALTSADRQSGLAQLALTLARQVDEFADSPSAVAVLGRELRIALTELLKNSARETTDGIDELRARRAGRRQAAG